jgi:ABC-type multidrug transport system ATPase subunit
MRFRIIAHDGSAAEREITVLSVRFGRDPACEVAFDVAEYPQVSGVHARLDQTAAGAILTPLSRSNKTLLNDQSVDSASPVKPGDRIRLGVTGPIIELLALTSAGGKPAPGRSTGPQPREGSGKTAESHEPGTAVEALPEAGATVQAAAENLALLRGSLSTKNMPIRKGGIIGRERDEVDFLLDHPHVSRRHARLRVDGDDVLLKDLGSANGTFVNGKRAMRWVTLTPGDRIDVGPFSLEFDGRALLSRSRSNNIELVARRLKRVVKDRATGKPLTLLDDISLVVRPTEFVCLLGPSGSGKSTLLDILSGRNPPDRGSVWVNGEDLFENFAALKEDIAVVPQKDVLHDSLAVGSALGYTAQLRLPPDMSRADLASSVADMLQVVGLSKRRGTLIRHLSGGQVKRASLANELMARPSLLFLDEVTSGLDEQTDRDMMELFRQVADSGKTVICITHSLANVEHTCHLVVILTEGGRLAFVGTPDEARHYFNIERLGDVYKKLAGHTPADWQADFKGSPFYARYIRKRLPREVDDESDVAAVHAVERIRVNPLRQTWVLMRRYLAVWRGDPVALLALLGQALLVALLLGSVFGNLDDKPEGERIPQTRSLLFLLSVSCFWFGCNCAAKELVKERVIYRRERGFNLRIDSYFISKFSVLLFISLSQVTLLFAIVRLWCGPPGAVLAQWLALATVAVAGTALGLLVSAVARTEEVAVALVPMVIIPQIILAGVIVPVTGFAAVLAKGLVPVYWAQQALDAVLPDREQMLLGLDPPTCAASLLGVAAHLVICVTATIALLWWQDRIRTK